MYSGIRYGNFVIIAKTAIIRNKQPMWAAQCDCGNLFLVKTHSFLKKGKDSCGCLTREKLSRAMTTHGYRKEDVYKAIEPALKRCYDTKHRNWILYGGCDITVCDEWRFNRASFCQWALNNGYRKGLCLDRIDNKVGYCPENCRWVPDFLNGINKSGTSNVLIVGISFRNNSPLNPFEARMKLGKLHISLGYFPTILDAYSARKGLTNKLFYLYKEKLMASTDKTLEEINSEFLLLANTIMLETKDTIKLANKRNKQWH